jgi:hypothetical protein
MVAAQRISLLIPASFRAAIAVPGWLCDNLEGFVTFSCRHSEVFLSSSLLF